MNWSISKNNFFASLLLIGIHFISTAQNSFEEYKKQYPDFNEVVLLDYQGYDISIENKKIKIIQNTSFESMILSENGIHNNKESFTYSELVKLLDYDAYSIINVKGKEKKVKVTQTSEKNSSSSSVFFDDIKERQMVFPNLETGSKKVYHYKREFIDPFLLHKYMFIGGYPIKNATFEVKTDKNINIGYKIFNDPNNTIEFSKKEVKGKFIYTWTLKDVKAYKFEGNSPGILHSAPHIDIYIKDYTINNTKTEVLNDIDLLHKYYQGFVNNINKKECIDLKKITEDITKDKTSEEEKIKSIFYWVKDNIKYVAFENGYEGFIPRDASLVYERKFGDCKDMANIIVTMAQYENINNVNLCWIGTRDIPYSYTELAT
ncbi:transglutaminase-like domain-containing protein, partial [Flavobacterium sp.]